jgi:hypothetical protein
VTLQTKFRDLPADAYPFRIEATGQESGETLWTEDVLGPGVLQVPPLVKMHGEPVTIRVTFATGESHEEAFGP